ncbi:gamma-glutamyl-gamma-aminobutyrate hydrolase family protein [Leifsonia poae]|uniref:gamma-glutamyl-gamma-aminobutyrate hydrolase family protein n=1 Tax=Leifsonia poae TaxID=110933 RepID=UPI001CBEF3F8|nr:gamma-glutamyl-gamma-aminobutyrate hydrolase family protein [Leifsonia poae]
MSGQHPSRSLAVVEVIRFRGHDRAYHDYVQVLVGAAIAEAERQGWAVIRLAADQGEDALLARTEDADAILLMGGEDIAPAFYGGIAGYDGESRHLEAADAAQIALARRAIARETPLLGICRGLQIVNVALGGTLIQHLGEQSIHKNHGVPVREVMATHPVRLAAGSLVAGLLGGATVDVQSAHHQAVDRVGAGLVVTGRAPDGHVEAVEHESAPVLAVQWHPEDPGAPAGQLEALIASLDRVATPLSFAA